MLEEEKVIELIRGFLSSCLAITAAKLGIADEDIKKLNNRFLWSMGKRSDEDERMED